MSLRRSPGHVGSVRVSVIFVAFFKLVDGGKEADSGMCMTWKQWYILSGTNKDDVKPRVRLQSC